MKVHNLMEDIVTRVVDDLCKEKAHTEPDKYCLTEECRQDIVCYVLNRVPPRYVSSARGVAYTSVHYEEDPQLLIDILTLATEGLKRITSIRRPYYQASSPSPPAADYLFHFPVIRGRLLLAPTFEPAADITVLLVHEGKAVPMIDARWQNPYYITKALPGTFVFLPAPFPAPRKDEKASFELCIHVDKEGYLPLRHYFTIELSSRPAEAEGPPEETLVLPDLYLAPPDEESEEALS
ncbi:Late competence development protein ComFB [Spirochaeta thermophila DSM 6578]|uniref:Late competence development protein ComFB n=1 Tax=Winmispira thermophila (strain ATCC 700085 / DSM 6578 / Z-1203) TaxID=869211 RepID=G0GAJ9_WINT7|nr:late competence development ComFB family protein [Spirochaeta thermophila]AEJ60964.1 Late competence development protein ComFB [Spirochaeta thermophila DSM 6578]